MSLVFEGKLFWLRLGVGVAGPAAWAPLLCALVHPDFIHFVGHVDAEECHPEIGAFPPPRSGELEWTVVGVGYSFFLGAEWV
jgi:hypothetical protein